MRALFLPTEAHTTRVAMLLANQLRDRTLQPFVITLAGPVGAGKSVFARGFIKRWMRNVALVVPSPTFTIIQSYQRGNSQLHHADLYRLATVADLDRIGFDKLRSSQGGSSIIVEWPALLVERFPDWPRVDVDLALVPAPADTPAGNPASAEGMRRMQLTASWDAGREMLTRLDSAIRSSVD